MFILYFGMMSMVTPPAAMAAYAGAAIAGSDMLKTGVTASRFSLAGYLLPFMFVLNPAFLMLGTWPEIVMALLTGTVGVMALGALVAGHIRMPLRAWERVALLASAIVSIYPVWFTIVLELAVLTPVLVRQYGPAGIHSSPAKPLQESR